MRCVGRKAPRERGKHRNGAVEIAYERFGAVDGGPLLLIQGARYAVPDRRAYRGTP